MSTAARRRAGDAAADENDDAVRRPALMTEKLGVAALILVVVVGAVVATATSSGTHATAARRAVSSVSVHARAKAAAVPVASGTFTFAATGDVTLGRFSILPPGGAAALMRGARPYLHAGVTLGNLETTLGSSSSSKCAAGSANCFAFGAPASYAGDLRRARFTIMNVANNHANDAGASGEQRTLAALRKAGLRYTGRPGQIAYVTRNGIRIALIGFAPYPWAQSLLDLSAAARIVRKAAARANVVVVTMHAGAEGSDRMHVRPGPETYLGEERGNALAFAHAVVAAGADLVVGSGPHVLRGLEWYRGRLIAYSMGNFSGYKTLSTSGVLGVTAVLHTTVDASGRVVAARVVPMRLVGDGTPEYDPSHSAWSLLRDLSRADFGSRAAVVAADGSIRVPTRRVVAAEATHAD